MKKLNFFLLLAILILSFFLRVYTLDTTPPSLTWDEPAWGYNAYSLGIDGRDEFGRFLPYDYLESFGDFKPPMYAYLAILPIKVFGLNEFATRFPSAFFGVLTVLLTYFLVKEIFPANPKSEARKWRLGIPIVAAGLLAISPWHFMLSRAAFEANVATFFLVLGVFLFLRGINKNPWFIALSALSFVASMYTFNTSRIVAPLLVIMLGLGFWKKLLIYKKQVGIAVIVGMVVLLPIVPFLFSDQAQLRFKEVNIFSNGAVVNDANQQIANDDNVWWSNIIHNRRVGYALSYISHYFDNLSPHFLFLVGDGNPKFSLRDVGQMYLWELPFFIVGILFLFRKREGHWWVIPLWLLLGIIPAATARETPHSLRIETTLPMFQVLVAYGIVQVYTLINVKYQVFNIQLKKVYLVVLGMVVIFSLTYFLEHYYVHYPKEFAAEWQYGYKDAITYVKEVEKNYDVIYLTEAFGRPYAYMLFYKQYDPKLFREKAIVKRDGFGFVTVDSFDKYYFDHDVARGKSKRTIYIVTPPDVPENAAIKKTFYLPNGKVALVAYTTD